MEYARREGQILEQEQNNERIKVASIQLRQFPSIMSIEDWTSGHHPHVYNEKVAGRKSRVD